MVWKWEVMQYEDSVDSSARQNRMLCPADWTLIIHELYQPRALRAGNYSIATLDESWPILRKHSGVTTPFLPSTQPLSGGTSRSEQQNSHHSES